MPAHTGRRVAEHSGTTAISANGESFSVLGLPVFSDEDDWCLVRPSKPVAEADIELSREPSLVLYIVMKPLEGGSSRLVACRPASWPQGSERSGTAVPASSPATLPATGPCHSEHPSEGQPFGLRTTLLAGEPMGPGTSGSPVVFYDKQTRRFRVCGMLVVGSDEYPTLVQIVPFWWRAGAELIDKRQKAEKEDGKSGDADALSRERR